MSSGVVDLSVTLIVVASPPAGVTLISASFACFGTSAVKLPSASDVTFFSCPSGVLIVTSVFGLVLPLTVVVSFAGSFSALPSVMVGLSSGGAAFSVTLMVVSSPPAGVTLISASFACFGTSAVKLPSASDVTFFSCPSGVLIVTSVFGLVLPLTVVVSFAGSFSALPSVMVGLSVFSATLTLMDTSSVVPSL